jgi:transcription-repair coupling factor (superfamily II helicase)
MIEYGTNIIAGVTPRKGGQIHLDRPVFNTVKETVDELQADTSIIFVPPAYAANAIIEEIEINSGIACIIPETYLSDVHERLILYKRIASAKDDNELKELKIEMIDRFGLLPDQTKNLFESTSLRIFAEKFGVKKINIFDEKTEITLNNNSTIEAIKIINLIQKQPSIFQLKNQNTLIFNKEMEHNLSRIEKVRELLSSLV